MPEGTRLTLTCGCGSTCDAVVQSHRERALLDRLWKEVHSDAQCRVTVIDPDRDGKLKRMIFAAYDRCPCGAGLAYWKNPTHDERHWDCSAIMLGDAVPMDEPGSAQHTDRLPFAFWEVKSENQPSASGATTRP